MRRAKLSIGNGSQGFCYNSPGLTLVIITYLNWNNPHADKVLLIEYATKLKLAQVVWMQEYREMKDSLEI